MMKDTTKTYEYYTPVPEHTISDLTTLPNGTHIVTVENIHTGEEKTFEVSFCAILIGSRPDLRFISNINKSSNTQSLSQKSISITNSLLIDKSSENNNNNTTITTIQPITNSPNLTLFGRKLTWLKNLCAKCKHLNLCDWNRTTTNGQEQQKIITKIIPSCNHNNHNSLNCCINNNITSKETISVCSLPFTISNNDESCGLGLGIDPSKPIDCKTNQIAVNKFTNEVLNGSKGLYAMGPLVGDNFVRFIPGGALAITSALVNNKEND